MRRLIIILICAALLLLSPCKAWAEPVVYRTVAFVTKNTEVSFWYSSGRMPMNASVVVANTRRGKVCTVKITYWTGKRWTRVRTTTEKARKDDEPLFFDFALHGIKDHKGVDIKLKIDGRLLKLDCKRR